MKKLLMFVSTLLRKLVFLSVRQDLSQYLSPLKPEKLKIYPRIRLWKLGDTNKNIFPTQESYDRFKKFLSEWDGQKDLDIVWNDLISCEVIHGHPDDVDIIVDEQGNKHVVIKGQ